MWVEGRWVKFYVEEMQKTPSVARIFFPRERNSEVYLSFLLRPQQQTEVWVHHGSFWKIHAFASFQRWGVTYRNVNVSSRKDSLHRLHWVGRWLSHSHADGAPLTCSFSIYSSPFPRPHAIRAELHTVDGPEQLNIQARVSSVFLAGSITLATLWLLLLPCYLAVEGSCTASYPVCRFFCSGPAELYTACVSCDQS